MVPSIRVQSVVLGHRQQYRQQSLITREDVPQPVAYGPFEEDEEEGEGSEHDRQAHGHTVQMPTAFQQRQAEHVHVVVEGQRSQEMEDADEEADAEEDFVDKVQEEDDVPRGECLCGV